MRIRESARAWAPELQLPSGGVVLHGKILHAGGGDPAFIERDALDGKWGGPEALVTLQERDDLGPQPPGIVRLAGVYPGQGQVRNPWFALRLGTRFFCYPDNLFSKCCKDRMGGGSLPHPGPEDPWRALLRKSSHSLYLKFKRVKRDLLKPLFQQISLLIGEVTGEFESEVDLAVWNPPDTRNPGLQRRQLDTDEIGRGYGDEESHGYRKKITPLCADSFPA